MHIAYFKVINQIITANMPKLNKYLIDNGIIDQIFLNILKVKK